MHMCEWKMNIFGRFSQPTAQWQTSIDTEHMMTWCGWRRQRNNLMERVFARSFFFLLVFFIAAFFACIFFSWLTKTIWTHVFGCCGCDRGWSMIFPCRTREKDAFAEIMLLQPETYCSHWRQTSCAIFYLKIHFSFGSSPTDSILATLPCLCNRQFEGILEKSSIILNYCMCMMCLTRTCPHILRIYRNNNHNSHCALSVATVASCIAAYIQSDADRDDRELFTSVNGFDTLATIYHLVCVW